MQRSIQTSTSSRRPELDGVRGLAILLVLLWHYIHAQMAPNWPEWLAWTTNKTLGFTWSGVDLFFVLSGFLIGGILLDNLRATNYFQIFYIRRVCRILPLYFFLLAVYVVALGAWGQRTEMKWLLDQPLPTWSYVTFTQNILMGIHNRFGANWLAITWSLAVEEQFYLCLPLLLFLVPPKWLSRVLLSGVVLAIVLRGIASAMRGPYSEVPEAMNSDLYAFLNLPWRMDSLLLGVLLAQAVRSERVLSWFKERLPQVWVGFWVLLGGVVMISFNRKSMTFFGHTWLALFYSLLILVPILEPEGWLKKWLCNRVLVWLGVVSYGVYMYHQLVMGMLNTWVLGKNDHPQMDNWKSVVMMLAAVVVTMLVSAVSYHVFEKHFVAWGHRFRYRKP